MEKQHLHVSLIREALELARDAIRLGEVPIAAVVARSSGEIIGWGWNELNAKRDRTAHAEMAAFRDAAGRYPLDCDDLILACTLEPCVMCVGAAMLSGIRTIIYSLPAPADGGVGRIKLPSSPESQSPVVIGNVIPDESRALFELWLERHPEEDAQRAYVRQLLASNPQR